MTMTKTRKRPPHLLGGHTELLRFGGGHAFLLLALSLLLGKLGVPGPQLCLERRGLGRQAQTCVKVSGHAAGAA